MNKILAALMIAAGVMSAGVAQADGDSPWMVRARAVNLNFANHQTDQVKDLNIKADDRWIPEADISYFFTKNIAAELVLTYPQDIDVKLGGSKLGSVRALPPSLLLQYHFTDLGAFKPYVGAGVNYTLFSKRNNIGGIGASVDSSSTGYVAQVGFDYAIDKNWSFNLDLKYATMDTDVKLNGSKLGKLDLNPTMLGVGFGYRF
ncbi:MAG: OmpW family protein [Betaproteobacteria bacterium]|nr:OmpW family protein [Betaproteobacteria bacterium]